VQAEHWDGSMESDATPLDRYAVERQVIYRQPPHERNYWIAWAIWDRCVKTFLATLFASREEAERQLARMRTQEEVDG